MRKIAKDMVKMGVAFFIVGAAMALIGSTIAEAIGYTGEALAGIQAANSTPLWTATFFGMFGALSTIVPTVIGEVLGLNEKPPAPKITVAKQNGITVKVVQQPELEPQFPYMGPEHGGYVAKIEAEKSQQSRSYSH